MLLINLAGLLLIALIVWWFWLYKPKAVKRSNMDTVIVVENGVYTPSRMILPSNETVTLQFLRKDVSPCSEMLLIPKLEISEALALNQKTKIVLPAMKPGHYDFHCQMQMYRGDLEVI